MTTKGLETETEVSVGGGKGDRYVIYRLGPDVARQLVVLLEREAARTSDEGWAEDAKKLDEAADKAEGGS